MLNHFRTLLLNESYNGPGENIPEAFYKKILPVPLEQLHNKLFIAGSSKRYRQFLIQSYLNVIKSCDLINDVLAFDNRISYSLTSEDYFRVERYSSPKVSDDTFEIEIITGFSTVEGNDYGYDVFLISQGTPNTADITVYSKTKLKYITEDGTEYDSPASALILLERDTVNITNTYYKPVKIGKTGITFRIIEPTTDAILDKTSLTFEFLIEGPYEFDVLKVFNNLVAEDSFKQLDRYEKNNNLEKYRNIWNKHFNPVYRLAAFLLAFVTVINTL